MIALFEKIKLDSTAKVWFARFENLKNLAHWHKEIEMIYIRHGSARVGINSEVIMASEGDVVLCGSGNIHYTISDEGAIIDILLIDANIMGSFGMDITAPYLNKSFLEAAKMLPGKIMDDIRYEMKDKKTCYKQYIHGVLTEFFSLYFRNVQKIESKSENNKLAEITLYQKLIDYIDEYYAEVTFKQAAEIMCFSPSYFSRIFKDISGMTFTEYLSNVRIEKAVEMIKSEQKKMVDIAYECGFDSVRHFNRVFKELTGRTPTEINRNYDFKGNLIKVYKNNHAFNPTISTSIVLD